MLSKNSAAALRDLNLLSPEHLDAVYSHVSNDEATDAENQKASAASEVVQASQGNPDIADIVSRVNAALNPDPTPTPTPATPTPGPALALPPSPSDQLPPQPQPTPIPVGGPGPDIPIQQSGATGTWEEPSAPIVASPEVVGPVASPMDKALAGDKAGALEHVAIAANQKRAEVSQSAKALHSDAQVLGEVADQALTLKQMQTESLGKVNKALDKYDTLQVDPDRFWATRTTGEKISAYIGIILSGLGGGSKGIDAINGAIKEDMDIQRANFELQKQGIEMRRGVLSDMHAMTQDEQAANALAETAAYHQASLQIQRAEAATSNVVAQANLAKARMEMDALSDDAKQRSVWHGLNSNVLGQDSKGENRTTQQVLGYQIPVIPDEITQDMLPKEERSRWVAGLGVATDEQTAKDKRAAKDTMPSLLSEISSLKALRQGSDGKGGAGVETSVFTDSEVRAKAKPIWLSILNKIREIEKFGALDTGTQEVFRSVVPEDPLGPRSRADVMGWGERLGIAIGGDPLIAQLDQFEHGLKVNYRNKMSQNMSRITQSAYRQIATGDTIEDQMKKMKGASK